MISSDQDLLSARASVIWIAGLCVVLISHCSHLIRMRGEHRWYHSAHVLMLAGMLYMYAAVAFGLEWISERIWMIVYVAGTAAIIGWMLARIAHRRSVSNAWILVLVQQGAMIYMCAPMKYWVPKLSYAFVVYFALETTAWLAWAYNKPGPGNDVAQAGGSVVVPLVPRSTFNDVCMMIMAASMAYMFAGMQLMMSMPQQSRQLAQQRAPQESVSIPGHDESGLQTPASTANAAVHEPARLSAETSSPASAGRYTVGPGDSLSRIAARLYGDARQWHSIMKANPGLNPRRLRIGQVVKLPSGISHR